MPDLPTSLARMTVTVASPDGRVRVEATARASRVSFTSPGAHREYRDAAGLSAQMSAALNAAAGGLAKGRGMLLARHPRLRPVDAADGAAERYRDAEASLSVEGVSPKRLARARLTGETWEVQVVPGAAERLGAAALAAEVNGAVAEAVRLRAEARYELKSAAFGRVGPPRQ